MSEQYRPYTTASPGFALAQYVTPEVHIEKWRAIEDALYEAREALVELQEVLGHSVKVTLDLVPADDQPPCPVISVAGVFWDNVVELAAAHMEHLEQADEESTNGAGRSGHCSDPRH